jgi:hypothetical protein
MYIQLDTVRSRGVHVPFLVQPDLHSRRRSFTYCEQYQAAERLHVHGNGSQHSYEYFTNCCLPREPAYPHNATPSK